MTNGESTNVARALHELETQGYACLRHGLDPNLCRNVRQEIHSFQAAGRFKTAGIGKGPNHQANAEIRRDGSAWFDSEDLSPVQAQLLALLESYRVAFNESLYLGLWDLEGHYAVYEPGAFYRKHLDRFQND